MTKKNPNSSLGGRGLNATSLAGAVPPHFRGLRGSLGPIPSREPPSGPERLSLSAGILYPDPGTGDAAAGSSWRRMAQPRGTPAPSCTALKPGRGLAPHRLPPPPPPPLHPTHKTGNHKHPSQLCERTYIFSTHSIQYSKKSYRFLKKKKKQQKTNHQTFKVTTKASKSLPTLQP